MWRSCVPSSGSAGCWATNEELARKVAQHDQVIGILFEHIQGLLEPPESPKKHPIGFRVTDDED